jgi:hypothetical protein
MSEPEDFLRRWSRRKREAEEAGTPEAAIEPPRDEQIEDGQRATPALQGDDSVADLGGFDPANLPSVDLIGADTDIRDFLRPGVPQDLTREALRRAWTSDPSIRDYIGPVENGWDFNDPNTILGFGTIKAEEAPRLLARVFEAPIVAKSEPSVPKKPAMQQQDLPSPQTLSTATATPGVAGPDVHARAEPPSSDANVTQGTEPSSSGAKPAQQGEPSGKIGSAS